MKARIRILFSLLFASFFMQAQISKKKDDVELKQINSMVTEAKAVSAQVIATDLVVQGSACVGFDCVNGESFGFDTFRLKENNLRIKAQDTSVSASFPSNDWQITFNDTSNGGQNKFSIDDIDGGRTPFTIEASAPSHSLYVDDGGRVGFGTATPVVEMHSVDGDTPTLRLDQDGSSGFTPQTWDIAGNEAGFFIRDVTNGSKLSFRIEPNSPAESIFIKPSGVNIKNVALLDPSSPSDSRLKTQMIAIKDATSTLVNLYPKTFYFNQKAIENFDFPEDLQYGLVAQEVSEILPDLIKHISLGEKNEEFLSVQYESLIPILIQGFKEQKQRIDELENEVSNYASLDNRLRAMETQLNSKNKNAKR